MDKLGSEIGHKMRSAVKAKLIELGSGTSSGYIDDELPDYVMIMVANKRSKEQMIEDLSLFLDKNTEAFVKWLHQVLEKLQEVTLPAPSISKLKKKTTDAGSDKKEKKNKKKLKRVTKDKHLDRSNTPPISIANVTSISDVFADHLMQKAKQTLDEQVVLKTKPELTVGTSSFVEDATIDEFDIPTISEIAKNAAEKVVCRKEFSELEELQKKINQAKRQLRQITDESEDDDFINLRADKHDLETAYPNEEASGESINSVDSKSTKTSIYDTAKLEAINEPIAFRNTKELNDDSQVVSSGEKRRSIYDRLGNKPRKENIISLSANRRIEQALYVPGYRRNDLNKESQNDADRRNQTAKEYASSKTDTGNDLNRISRGQNYAVADLRQKVQTKRLSRIKSVQSSTSSSKRIGSRVIVAPPRFKTVLEKRDVVVGSVVNIQPRPVVPKNKQACKSLLLRAVAEAQKSIALGKPTHDPQLRSIGASKNHLVEKTTSDKVSPKRNIIVEVETSQIDINKDDIVENVVKEHSIAEKFSEDMYSSGFEPHSIQQDLTSHSNTEKRTQFVVTLDSRRDYRSYDVMSSSSSIEMVEEKPIRKRALSPISTDKTVNKLIIKNDTEDEEELRKETESSMPSSTKTARKSSEIDVMELKRKRLKRDNSHSKENSSGPVLKGNNSAESDDGIECAADMQKIRTSKISGNKYENLPSLSSAIAVTTSELKFEKKERCKFYPSCGKGERCEFVHPSTACKTFPNCKFGDQCLYLHPKCKFDLTCSRLGCNFIHTVIVSSAPPISSHVVPVSNYKKIVTSTLTTLCKFYPKCSNTLCEFYHPKPCKFGKNCNNKIECNFYHFDSPNVSKNRMKWVASDP